MVLLACYKIKVHCTMHPPNFVRAHPPNFVRALVKIRLQTPKMKDNDSHGHVCYKLGLL